MLLVLLALGAVACEPSEQFGVSSGGGSRVVAAGSVFDAVMAGDGQAVGYVRVFDGQPLLRIRRRDGSTTALDAGTMPDVGDYAYDLSLSNDSTAVVYAMGNHVVRAAPQTDGSWTHTVLSQPVVPGSAPLGQECAYSPRITADGQRVVFGVNDGCYIDPEVPGGDLVGGVYVWSAPGVSVPARTPVWSSPAEGRLDRLSEFGEIAPSPIVVSAGGRWVGATVREGGSGPRIPALADMATPGVAAQLPGGGVIDQVRSDGRMVLVVDGGQVRRVDRDSDADGVFDEPGTVAVETVNGGHPVIDSISLSDDRVSEAVAASEDLGVVTWAANGGSLPGGGETDRLLTARRLGDGTWKVERDVDLQARSVPCTLLAASDASNVCYWSYRVSMSASGSTTSFLTFDRNDAEQAEVHVTVPVGPRLGTGSDIPWAADPVNTASGSFVDSAVDLGGGGAGPGFARAYNSVDERSGVLGPGWSTLLDVAVTRLATGNRSVRLGDGRTVEFTQGAEGAWTGPSGFDARLVDVAGGAMELRWDDGRVHDFDEAGLLERIRQPDGVTVELVRGEFGDEVSAMSWTVGGVERNRLSFGYLDFAATPASAAGRLGSITDGEGRQVSYSYRQDPGEAGWTTLDRVSRPHREGADRWSAGWTDFDTVDGRITRTAESVDAALDPARASVRMRTLVVNAYDGLGRVASQTTGDGATLSFAYDSPSPGLTSVTGQPSGEATVYGYDGEGRQVSVTDSTGNSTSQQWTLEGERGLATDRAGAQQRTLHDDDGRLRARILPDPATGVVAGPPAGSGWQDVALWADRYETWTYVNDSDPADHRVDQHRDAVGSVTRYTYDGTSHRAATVTTAYGTPIAATTEIGYGTGVAADRPVQVTDPDGVVTVNGYDAGGDLVETVAGGRITGFDERLRADPDWDPAWSTADPAAASAMVVTRPIGDGTGSRSWVSVFDAEGRVLRSIDPLGASRRTRYFDDGSIAEALDELGAVTSSVTRRASDWFAPRDPAGTCEGVCPPSNGWTEPAGITRIETSTDPDAVRMVSAFDGSGDMVEERVDGPGTPASITRHQYGPLGRLERSERPGGTAAAPVAQVVTFGYDVNGNQTTVTEGPTLGDPARTATTVFDKAGRVTDVWGPAAESPRRHTRYAYDTAGREIARIDAAEDPAARLMTSTRYDPAGRVIEVVRFTDGFIDTANPYPALADHPTAEVTRTSYTATGKPRTVVTGPPNETSWTWPAAETPAQLDALGFNGPRRVTRYDYDPVTGDQVTEQRPDGTVVRTGYDSVGRAARTDLVAAPGGPGAPVRLIARYGFDRADRVVETHTPWTRPDGTTIEVAADTTYWATGQTRTETDPYAPGTPAGEIPTRSYSYTPGGRVAEVTDANGDIVRYIYDGRGNRTERRSLARGSGTVESVQTWSWTLDDQTATWTLPHTPGTTAPVWTATYDDRGRQASVADPSGRSQAFAYTPSGEVASRTSRTGAADPTPTVDSFTHDGAGRRTSATTPVGSFSWTHDRLGRLTQATQPGAGGALTAAYTWDLAGNRRQVTYPDGGRYRFTHDPAGRVDRAEAASGPPETPVWAKVVDYGYDGFGDLTAESLGDGGAAGSRTWTRDDAGQVSGFDQVIVGQGGDPNTTWTTDFTRRPDGRVASEITNAQPRVDYGYDPAGQLTSATPTTGPGAQSWTYGTAGRRRTSTVDGTNTTYSWDVARRRLNGTSRPDEGRLFSHDAAGRRTADGHSGPGGSATVTTGYDDTGRLGALTGPSGVPTTRTYGPDDNLIQTRFGTAPAHDIVWDNATAGVPDLLWANWADHTTRGVATTRIDTFPGEPPAYQATDAYGSTTDTPATTAPDTYSPHGEPTGWSGGPHAYRSELYLDKLLHLRARDYDPTTSTFTTPDPLDTPDGTPTNTNTYHYTDNDPLNKTDPTGMRPQDQAFRDPCSDDPNDVERMGSYLGSELNALGPIFGFSSFDSDSCYAPSSPYPNFERLMCALNPLECNLGQLVVDRILASTEAQYVGSSLSVDGSRINSYHHILLASALTVTFDSASDAKRWLIVHEIARPHPVQPRLDQADKANNFYGVRIGTATRASLDSPGTLALTADLASAPQNVHRHLSRFIEFLEPVVKSFVDRGKSCELINPTSSDPFDKEGFVDPTRCGYT